MISAVLAKRCRMPAMLGADIYLSTVGGKRNPTRLYDAGVDALAVAAEPSYRPALAALVQSTGAVRIRADGNVYAASLGKQMRQDYQAVLAACTRR